MESPKSLPPELASTVKISWLTGMINWKSIMLIVMIVFGGGGIAALDLVSKDGVQQKIDKSLMYFRSQEDARHIKLDMTISQQGRDLDEIKKVVGEVQTVQHRQIAREEARRITCDIKNRRERERRYDTLLDLNLRRLSSGLEPCRTLTCE